MKEIKTITIGIPAHNEEKNIGVLLSNLLNQETPDFVISQIIIVLDDCSDKSKEIVESYAKEASSIKIIQNSQRLGKCISLNEIHQHATGDVLITLDADVLPVSNLFISEFIRPFKDNENIGLAGAKVIPVKGKNLIEKVINYSQIMKTESILALSAKHNVFLCHGRARAYSKDFYNILRYPENIIADDAYSYFECLKSNKRFIYVQNAIVGYRSPSTLKDFVRQNKRFKAGALQLRNYFDLVALDKEYSFSNGEVIKSAMLSFAKSPIFTVIYMFLLILGKFSSYEDRSKHLWEMVMSSKEVIK